jgi:hypothetical protein
MEYAICRTVNHYGSFTVRIVFLSISPIEQDEWGCSPVTMRCAIHQIHPEFVGLSYNLEISIALDLCTIFWNVRDKYYLCDRKPYSVNTLRLLVNDDGVCPNMHVKS